MKVPIPDLHPTFSELFAEGWREADVTAKFLGLEICVSAAS